MVDLGALVVNIYGNLETEFRDKKVKIEYSIQELPSVYSQETRLRQILINLFLRGCQLLRKILFLLVEI